MKSSTLVFLPITLVALVACGSGGDPGSSASGTGGGSTSTGGSTGTGMSTTGTGSTGTGGGSGCDALPTGGVYATFTVVGNQTYYASITNAAGIDQAIALWKGTSTAAIPNGKLVCSSVPWNCPWGFHQDPATITFADVTIEVCDGTPSYVDENCASFGTNYCPWAATLTDLRDCRTDPACPVVPKQ